METNRPNKPRLDLAEVRQKLAGKTGKKYWRTLEEVADTPEFQLFLEDEFPNRSTLAQINRRDLLKFMGASLALAGLSGCRGVFLPEDKVVPYVKQPEELVPGEALFYASAITLAGFATGVIVEQHEGRPTEIAGNPMHPASLGAADVMTQAEVLSLYDPDRANTPTNIDELSTWPAFEEALADFLKTSIQGEGLRILTGTVTSPTFVAQMEKLQAKLPNLKWHAWEPCGRIQVMEGANLAFGQTLNTYYDFSKAKCIVSLDGDFLNPTENPGSLAYARQFANGRRVTGATGTMNRLYAMESTPGLVGMVADHRWPVRAFDIYSIASALAAAVKVPGVAAGSVLASLDPKALTAIANDLTANAGASIVVTGPHQPAEVHALVQAINHALGNVGKTVFHTKPVEATVIGKVEGLKALVDDMNAGAVTGLFVLDCNPAYNGPADLPFADAVSKVKFKVQLSMSQDETTRLMDWHLPMTHQLEAWGDARSYEGTASIVQPLIAPLTDGKSPIEFLSVLSGKPLPGYDLVRDYWRTTGLGGDFEKNWRRAVHDGVIANTAFPQMITVSPTNAGSWTGPKAVTGLEVVFRPDPSIFDGRFANNGWLQELPKPVTKITWDNVILISPKFADQNHLVSDDRVQLTVGGASVIGPVFVQPGHPDNTVTVNLGFGRTGGGVVATVNTEREGGGFNSYALRTSAAYGFVGDAELKALGGQLEIASTQGHSPLNGDRVIDDRDVIREASLAEYLAKGPKALIPEDAPTAEEIRRANLYPEQIFEWNGPQWGMTIDMNTCIGCNACVMACVAENNIPVVGKEQVARHREMHWIRIDRYYSGDDANPQLTWQPLMCVQCEKAPCEPVCPVAATVHSHEGLNQMIYNRCVGTRYCSNNCPYKVRHFNYLNYSDNQPNYSDRVAGEVLNQSLIPGPLHVPRKNGIELLRLLNNPNVTVRGRGVMEKCTYCTQRISAARIEAKKAGREIADGEIVTACQQACPTQTIVFGNIADTGAAVTKLRNDPRSYLLLEEMQTRPRTSHLAKLRNPNPEITA